MLQNIQVYIDQENIDVLSDILLRYRGLLEGDMVRPLQVQSVEQQLLAGRATLAERSAGLSGSPSIRSRSKSACRCS